jgi:sugar phosphate isomerase/epimerase
MIYKEASPKLYQQIDTANTFHVGYDVVALLKKYPNRHFSIHAKENVPTKDGVLGVPPTDGGKCVPWKDLIAYMQTESGLHWWIVEAEGRPDSLDPALACLKQLKAWTN